MAGGDGGHGPRSDGPPPGGQAGRYRRHRGVLHLAQRQPVRFEWAVAPEVVVDLVRQLTVPVEGRVGEHAPWADQAPGGDLVAEADDAGLAVEASRVGVTQRHRLMGTWCEPRMLPATACGKANGSRASPTAGRPDWQRTIITGSSLPT
jgi:hypothetical protein